MAMKTTRRGFFALVAAAFAALGVRRQLPALTFKGIPIPNDLNKANYVWWQRQTDPARAQPFDPVVMRRLFNSCERGDKLS